MNFIYKRKDEEKKDMGKAKMYAQRVKMDGAFGLRARVCVCVSISNCNNYISVHIWLEKVTRYVPSFSFFVFFFCFFLRRRFLHELTSQNVSMMLSKQKKNFICPFSSLVWGDCFLLRSP